MLQLALKASVVLFKIYDRLIFFPKGIVQRARNEYEDEYGMLFGNDSQLRSGFVCCVL